MTSLFLGVIDQPYTQGPIAPRRAVHRRNRRSGKEESFSAPASGQATTGDVAGYLEAKYHVHEIFFEEHKEEIGNDLAHAMAGALENLMQGAPVSDQPLKQATDWLQEGFQEFIDSKAMDALGYPGIPTAASIKGVRHRKTTLEPGRPSFQDTGIYEASFAAWVE